MQARVSFEYCVHAVFLELFKVLLAVLLATVKSFHAFLIAARLAFLSVSPHAVTKAVFRALRAVLVAVENTLNAEIIASSRLPTAVCAQGNPVVKFVEFGFGIGVGAIVGVGVGVVSSANTGKTKNANSDTANKALIIFIFTLMSPLLF